MYKQLCFSGMTDRQTESSDEATESIPISPDRDTTRLIYIAIILAFPEITPGREALDDRSPPTPARLADQ